MVSFFYFIHFSAHMQKKMTVDQGYHQAFGSNFFI